MFRKSTAFMRFLHRTSSRHLQKGLHTGGQSERKLLSVHDLGGVDFGQKRGKEGQSNVNHTEIRRKYDGNEEPKGWVALQDGNYGCLRLRSSRKGTISELAVLVRVRVSSRERRNASLSAKAIRLRAERNSVASKYTISSLAVR